MFSITFGKYGVLCSNEVPIIYEHYCKHARLVEEFQVKDIKSDYESGYFFVAFNRENDWPFLVVTQWYFPFGYGFSPGITIIPETDIVFIGAGERLLAYQLDDPRRLWEDSNDSGFWGWHRYGDYVVMSAELEMAVWNIHGKKLWSTFVEPPWTYEISDKTIQLDVMGKIRNFPIDTGPA